MTKDAILPVVPKLSPGPIVVERAAQVMAGKEYSTKGLPKMCCPSEYSTLVKFDTGIFGKEFEDRYNLQKAGPVLSRYSNLREYIPFLTASIPEAGQVAVKFTPTLSHPSMRRELFTYKRTPSSVSVLKVNVPEN
jgi:hypothetical protein